MSKINYTKVEESLLSARDKQQREELLQQAGHAKTASSQEEVTVADPGPAPEAALASMSDQEKDQLRVTRFKLLQQRLRWFFKQDPQFHLILGVSKETVVRCLDSQPDQLSPEDWKAVDTLDARCAEKKEAIEALGGLTTDEKWIKKTRRKLKKKPFRFHTNDKWLAT